MFVQTIDAYGDMCEKSGKKVFFKKLESGEYVKYDEEKDVDVDKYSYVQVLTSCKIRVDNLTLSDYVKRNENDIYYALVSL